MDGSARQILQRLAEGDPTGLLLLSEVIADFETRTWAPAETDSGRHSRPDDNSPDWIELTEGLGPSTRLLLRQAYERAVQSVPTSSDPT